MPFNKYDEVVIVNRASPFYGFKGKITRITRWGKYNVEGKIPPDRQTEEGYIDVLLPDEIQIQITVFAGLYNDNEIASIDEAS